jgi:hypothetical protein
VVEKLKQFSAILRDSQQPLSTRQEALKWVIHLTGDIHQPFHAIADGRGGNDVPIQEAGSSDCGRYSCQLHALGIQTCFGIRASASGDTYFNLES